jgi:hypothetical protein
MNRLANRDKVSPPAMDWATVLLSAPMPPVLHNFPIIVSTNS